MIAVPPENQLVNCREPHAEFLDTATGTVWQPHLPITAEEWAELTLPEPLVKLGLGRGAMDEHWFRCSPGAEAPGAVSERTVAGRRFIHCANPPAGGGDRPVQGGPVRLFVDKHHSLCFHAGRTAQILRLPDGREYVQVIEASPEGGGLLQQGRASMAPPLPDGWMLRGLLLDARTVVHLPSPTEAWFFANGASFQGPVEEFTEAQAR